MCSGTNQRGGGGTLHPEIPIQDSLLVHPVQPLAPAGEVVRLHIIQVIVRGGKAGNQIIFCRINGRNTVSQVLRGITWGRGLNGGVLLLKGEELEEHVGGTLRIPVFHLTQGGRHEFDLAKAVTHRFKLYSTG